MDEEPTIRSPGRVGAAPRVLLVDDDAALAEMLSLVLLNEGFDPSWCGHGDEALGAFWDARPDLVLLDVMLPGTDGVSICRAIRAESWVPIVMLTARSDSVDVVAGLLTVVDDHVIVDELAEIVEPMLVEAAEVAQVEQLDVDCRSHDGQCAPVLAGPG